MEKWRDPWSRRHFNVFDADTVMIALSCNLLLYKHYSMKAKVPVKTVWEKQNKYITVNYNRGGETKVVGYYFENIS